MRWYIEALKKYAVFAGRARRKEYWIFLLFNIIISFVLFFLERLAGGPGLLSGLYDLFILIPSIAVTVRRLHDTNRTRWWFLIVLVPLIGAIVLLVFMLQDSQPDANQYGPNPKGAVAA